MSKSRAATPSKPRSVDYGPTFRADKAGSTKSINSQLHSPQPKQAQSQQRPPSSPLQCTAGEQDKVEADDDKESTASSESFTFKTILDEEEAERQKHRPLDDKTKAMHASVVDPDKASKARFVAVAAAAAGKNTSQDDSKEGRGLVKGLGGDQTGWTEAMVFEGTEQTVVNKIVTRFLPPTRDPGEDEAKYVIKCQRLAAKYFKITMWPTTDHRTNDIIHITARVAAQITTAFPTDYVIVTLRELGVTLKENGLWDGNEMPTHMCVARNSGQLGPDGKAFDYECKLKDALKCRARNLPPWFCKRYMQWGFCLQCLLAKTTSANKCVRYFHCLLIQENPWTVNSTITKDQKLLYCRNPDLLSRPIPHPLFLGSPAVTLHNAEQKKKAKKGNAKAADDAASKKIEKARKAALVKEEAEQTHQKKLTSIKAGVAVSKTDQLTIVNTGEVIDTMRSSSTEQARRKAQRRSASADAGKTILGLIEEHNSFGEKVVDSIRGKRNRF